MGTEWQLIEEGYDRAIHAKQESLFALGNGYLGMRGFFEERTPAYHPGVFINGFYELEPISYGERAYGYAEMNQTMLDLPDARFVQIVADGEPVLLHTGTIHSQRRILDMKEGVLFRELDWESSEGSRLVITWETFISYTHQHTGAVKVSVRSVSCNRVEIHSSIAMPSTRTVDAHDPRVGTSSDTRNLHLEQITYGEQAPYPLNAEFSTKRSGMTLFCGSVHHQICAESTSMVQYDDEPFLRLVCASEYQQPLSVTKLFFYETALSAEADEARRRISSLLDGAEHISYDELRAGQRSRLAELWARTAISIPEDPELEKVLRFDMFQLYQSVGKDGKRSLSAKGLTGGGYEGHYFWDTEIYGMPFFTYTQPEIARDLLKYRISTISKARERAVQMSQKGILFPWRTINGDEASAYYPAGTAQYHINADIAYSLITYCDITGDDTIMSEGGAQLLFETARFWYDLGFFSERRGGAFCIHEVTGPDEYSALVNNNLYTNVMAEYNLLAASTFYLRACEQFPQLIELLQEGIGLTTEEPVRWAEAARKMYLPFDRELALHPQDESFLDRERWDFAAVPKDQYPLLLHFHPLVIYRYQVLKQADVVLAHVLLPDRFPWYEKRRDFRYYEELTTGDSSLSACIQGILAFELDDHHRALEHVRTTAFVDMHDVKGNVRDGLHTAAMGGAWMALVFGLAGMRRSGTRVSFSPVTPDSLPSYSFVITMQGSRLSVSVTKEYTGYRIISGPDLQITHQGDLLTVPAEHAVTVPTAPGFKAVIFDLDGVITSTDIFHYRAWKELADERGWEFDRELNEQLRGVSRRDSLQIICRHNGVTLTEEELQEATDRKNSTYRSLLEQMDSTSLLPGFRELCAELRAHDVRIGVASVSHNAPFIIRQLQIGPLIDFIAPADQTAAGKPDPEIFVRCSEHFAVPRGSCAACEDASAGIEAIRAAGMKCVGIGGAVKAQDCDLHVSGVSELSYGDLAALWD